jgi:hypothetical protein
MKQNLFTKPHGSGAVSFSILHLHLQLCCAIGLSNWHWTRCGFTCRKKIIINNIGRNVRATNLINKLCLQIVEHESSYTVLGKEIDQYCDNHWNRIMSTMKSVYFRDFWRCTATMVALIVLGFTFWNFLKPFVLKK